MGVFIMDRLYVIYINTHLLIQYYHFMLYRVQVHTILHCILTVKFLIASSTCRILLNRKNSVVKDRNLYTTSGI